MATRNALLDARLDALEAEERALRGVNARRSRILGEALLEVLAQTEGSTPKHRELAVRALATEVALIVTRSDRAALGQLDRAAALLEKLPLTQQRWEEGRIDRAHAECILRHGAAIDDDGRRAAYEAHLVDLAETTTPGRLEPLARRLASEANELSLEEELQRAEEERRVWIRPLGGGLAELGIVGPEVYLRLAYDRATAAANASREIARRNEAANPDEEPDRRTHDQRRADFALDVLLTADPAAIVSREDGGAPRIDATVTLLVPVLSMIGESREPCELRGIGPVPRGLAMDMCRHNPGWERALTDPITDVPLAVERYRPSAGMRRLLELRDERCRHPGCRLPARRCDLDHTVDAAAGGPTSVGNLAHLCRWHHVLKHQTQVQVEQLPGGRMRWTMPSGRVAIDEPELPRVRFHGPPAARPPGPPPGAPPPEEPPAPEPPPSEPPPEPTPEPPPWEHPPEPAPWEQQDACTPHAA